MNDLVPVLSNFLSVLLFKNVAGWLLDHLWESAIFLKVFHLFPDIGTDQDKSLKISRAINFKSAYVCLKKTPRIHNFNIMVFFKVFL